MPRAFSTGEESMGAPDAAAGAMREGMSAEPSVLVAIARTAAVETEETADEDAAISEILIRPPAPFPNYAASLSHGCARPHSAPRSPRVPRQYAGRLWRWPDHSYPENILRNAASARGLADPARRPTDNKRPPRDTCATFARRPRYP